MAAIRACREEIRKRCLELILERLPVTLSLAVLALFLALAVGIPLGVYAGVCPRGWAEYAAVLFGQLGLAIPSFWLGLLLILLFALTLRWLPPGGFAPWNQGIWQAFRCLILPGMALGLPLAAVQTRMTRAAVRETYRQDYIQVAYSKGLSENQVIFRHVLKNAMIPTVTVAGMQLAALLGGSLVIETAFFLPGLGRLVLFAIHNRDLPLIQGSVLFITALVVGINFAVELL